MVKPTDSGVSPSASSLSSTSRGGRLTISVAPKRNSGPGTTRIATGTSCGKSAASVRSETSWPAARMLICGP